MTKALCVVLLVAALTAIQAVRAAGFSPKLSSAQIARAESAGSSFARAHEGFSLGRYAVFSTADSLKIARGQGSVEAVIIATPYERVSYAAYLAAFQHAPLGKTALTEAVRPLTIDVLVVAHSESEKPSEQKFLGRFSAPSLDCGRYGRLPATAESTFGPTIDFFNVEDGQRVLRWSGYDDYRFDLSGLARRGVDLGRLTGAFLIADPYGRRYRVQFDLGPLASRLDGGHAMIAA